MLITKCCPSSPAGFVCHYQVHPIAHSLKNPTNRRMLMVIRRALTICTVLFGIVAFSGYAVFGPDTQQNLLTNLEPEKLADLVGLRTATVLVFCIRTSYCVCLMVSSWV